MQAGQAHPVLIIRMGERGGIERAAAGAAQLERASCKAVAHRHPLIEDEAFAPPQAFIFRHLFEIFQNAALEVINLVDPLGPQEAGRFLAANAPGAEHRDLLFCP